MFDFFWILEGKLKILFVCVYVWSETLLMLVWMLICKLSRKKQKSGVGKQRWRLALGNVIVYMASEVQLHCSVSVRAWVEVNYFSTTQGWNRLARETKLYLSVIFYRCFNSNIRNWLIAAYVPAQVLNFSLSWLPLY